MVQAHRVGALVLAWTGQAPGLRRAGRVLRSTAVSCVCNAGVDGGAFAKRVRQSDNVELRVIFVFGVIDSGCLKVENETGRELLGNAEVPELGVWRRCNGIILSGDQTSTNACVTESFVAA